MEHLLSGKQILVIDDNPDNLLLLVRVLEQRGYMARTAESGELGLQEIRQEIPDLILLDLQMPGIDGFEVCRILKENEETASIPVLIMSAADRIENITRGFSLGAMDFISKPFHNLEVLARVRTHLMNRIANDELLHMARQRSLGYLVMGIAHEVNTPLGNTITALSIAAEERKKMEACSTESERASSLGRMDEAYTIMSKSLNSLKSLVESLNEINPYSVVETEQEVQLADIIELVLSSTRHNLHELSCSIQVEIEEDLRLRIQHRILIQIITNLILNVIDHAFPDEVPIDQRSMEVNCRTIDGSAVLQICDTGCGIPEAVGNTLFDPFVTTKRGQNKTGLGLFIALNAVSSIHGSLSYQSRTGVGSVFTVSFPL